MPIIALSQIQTTIGDFEENIVDANVGHEAYMGPEFRFFIGTFHFPSLPKPLEPCKVDFILEISKETPYISDNDWEIRINYLNNTVQMTGDTAFNWPSPHKVGSKFAGSFEFIPLRSGEWGLTLYYHHPVRLIFFERMEAGIGFRWCLSPEGKLLYLGKGPGMTYDCSGISSIFFNRDSINIKPFPDDNDTYAFRYNVVIKPTPRIGDTATVHYYLKANENIPGGCDLTIYEHGFKIIELPEKMDYAISIGDELELLLKIVPLAMGKDHRMNLALNFEEARKDRFSGQSIICNFIFNNDSTLNLANTEGFPPDREDLYPTIFPLRKVGSQTVINIRRNENDSL